MELFLESSAEISNQDVFELLLEDPLYPYKKISRDIEGLSLPFDTQAESQIKRVLRYTPNQIKALSLHDLFK